MRDISHTSRSNMVQKLLAIPLFEAYKGHRKVTSIATHRILLNR